MSVGFSYRPDIDGLRAIAVLAVVLYHAEASGFSGGFVGVDIFFVISGYLITKIIRERIEAQEFSLIDFYERRTRRILPALFVMLAVCFVIGTYVLIPSDYTIFLKSTVASVLFSSNMYFSREVSYFAETPHHNLLLHTWSLAVEEQFYIVFPILIYLLYRIFANKLHYVVCAIALASFGLNVWMTSHYPRSAFFSAPPRAWELLLGGLIALGLVQPLRHNLWREALALLGLALIGGSIGLLASGSDFPGFNALYPTLGAALIIYTGLNGNTAVGRVLSARWLVFVGLISYSLYLWHWPLIVLARYVIIRPLSSGETASVVAVSLVVAVASQKLIEQPFRGMHGVMRRAGLFSVVGGSVAAFLVIGMVGLYGGSGSLERQARFSAEGSARTLRNPDRDECIGGVGSKQTRTPDDVRAQQLCRIGDGLATPSFILWGDSHAEAIRAGVDAAASAHNVSGLFVGNVGCPPAIGTRASFDGREYGDCIGLNGAVLHLLNDPNLQTVILHARWAFFSHGTRMPGELGPDVALSSAELEGSNNDILTKSLSDTIARLVNMRKHVVIVAGIPEIDINVPSFLARNKHFNRNLSTNVNNQNYLERNKEILELLKNVSDNLPVKILYPNELLCDDKRCRIVDNDNPLYIDDDHLSRWGALFLAPMFDAVFRSHTLLTKATQRPLERR